MQSPREIKHRAARRKQIQHRRRLGHDEQQLDPQNDHSRRLLPELLQRAQGRHPGRAQKRLGPQPPRHSSNQKPAHERGHPVQPENHRPLPPMLQPHTDPLRGQQGLRRVQGQARRGADQRQLRRLPGRADAAAPLAHEAPALQPARHPGQAQEDQPAPPEQQQHLGDAGLEPRGRAQIQQDRGEEEAADSSQLGQRRERCGHDQIGGRGHGHDRRDRRRGGDSPPRLYQPQGSKGAHAYQIFVLVESGEHGQCELELVFAAR